jgi:L-ribulose-5-phosphate 4-epimerase
VNMWEEQKKEVLEAAQQMDAKGLVIGTSGNVSLRFREPQGRELVAITPSGQHYDKMKAGDIVLVDLEGQRVEGELAPSIEHVACRHLLGQKDSLRHRACTRSFRERHRGDGQGDPPDSR